MKKIRAFYKDQFYYFTIGEKINVDIYNEICSLGLNFDLSTGLLDSNKVEIFENDYLKTKWGDQGTTRIGFGEFKEDDEYDDDEYKNMTDSVGFYFETNGGPECSFGNSVEGNTEGYTVVGNIYQNKENNDTTTNATVIN